jgi:hypothetical protein
MDSHSCDAFNAEVIRIARTRKERVVDVYTLGTFLPGFLCVNCAPKTAQRQVRLAEPMRGMRCCECHNTFYKSYKA